MRYSVTESRAWRHTSGASASIYGACPWTREADRAAWSVVSRGWTIRDNVNGTVGMGRGPYATEAEAQAAATRLNTRTQGV